MSFFGKGKTDTTAPLTLEKVTAPSAGKVSLSKGSVVSLDKGTEPIVVSNGWTAKGKDYDLKGLVRYHDGRTVYVGAANADEVMATQEGAVKHSGDARSPGELEKITVAWHSDIASIALSSYSALENGTGSFREYGVYVEIHNGSQVIGISAADANADGQSYTLCFGEVVFNPDGTFTVSNLEMYSGRGSENRIGYRGDQVLMDIGPVGQNK